MDEPVLFVPAGPDELAFSAPEFARKKKPTGRKEERRKVKLPNQIRHDQNAAIAVGTWKKRNKKGNGI